MEALLAEVENHFLRADADLLYIKRKLEVEFDDRFHAQEAAGDELAAHPMRLLEKLQNLKNVLQQTEKDAEQLVREKQDFVEFIVPKIVANRARLHQLAGNLQAENALSTSSSSASDADVLNQMLDTWKDDLTRCGNGEAAERLSGLVENCSRDQKRRRESDGDTVNTSSSDSSFPLEGKRAKKPVDKYAMMYVPSPSLLVLRG